MTYPHVCDDGWIPCTGGCDSGTILVLDEDDEPYETGCPQRCEMGWVLCQICL